MQVVVYCAKCKVRLTLGLDRCGSLLDCPKCGANIAVPSDANANNKQAVLIPVSLPVKPPPSKVSEAIKSISASKSEVQLPVAIAENENHSVVFSQLNNDLAEAPDFKHEVSSYSRRRSTQKLKGIVGVAVIVALALGLVLMAVILIISYNPQAGFLASCANVFRLNGSERKIIGTWANGYDRTTYNSDRTFRRTKVVNPFFNEYTATYTITGIWSIEENSLHLKDLDSDISPKEFKEILERGSDTTRAVLGPQVRSTTYICEIEKINDKVLVLLVPLGLTKVQVVYDRSR